MLRGEGFAVCLTLTATTHSGRNDPSHDVASLSPVGVDDSEEDPIGQSDGDPTNLAVVLARVDALESGGGENGGGKGEVKLAIGQVPVTFLGIPSEAHLGSIRLYIHPRKRGMWLRSNRVGT